MSDWYVARTRARGESTAIRHLRQQGYETFCPQILKSVRHARRTALKPVPLFPSYLFVRIDLAAQRWRPVDSTPGVAALVKFDDRPSPLPRGLIECIKTRASAEGLLSCHGPSPAIGDEVRVIGGVFDNWVGQVVGLPAADRVTLLIDMISRKAELTVPVGTTFPVPRKKAAA